jgi:hypothetical protein
MPAAFDKCVADGGRVITKTINKTQYMHICYINGKSYSGEVKTKKAAGKPRRKK